MNHLEKINAIDSFIEDWRLQLTGTLIKIVGRKESQTDLGAPFQWCMDKITGKWHFSKYPDIMSLDEIEFLISDHRTVLPYNDYVTNRMMARAKQRQLAFDNNQLFDSGYFWFEDSSDALQFKLTWGGL
jgi:hypothetical protein